MSDDAARESPGESPGDATTTELANILEALMLASDQPLSLDALQRLLSEDGFGERKLLRAALDVLAQRYQGSALALEEVASGWRVRVEDNYAGWVHRLWAERPPKLSRALLETLAIICYRQPVTRSDIEEVRGVTVSSNILRTLSDRGWVREAGVKEVPGRPALLATTPQLLDDLGLKSLDELPTLPEIKDPEQLEAALVKLAEKRGIRLDDGDQTPAEAEQPDDVDDDTAHATPDNEQAQAGENEPASRPSTMVDPPEQLH